MELGTQKCISSVKTCSCQNTSFSSSYYEANLYYPHWCLNKWKRRMLAISEFGQLQRTSWRQHPCLTRISSFIRIPEEKFEIWLGFSFLDTVIIPNQKNLHRRLVRTSCPFCCACSFGIVKNLEYKNMEKPFNSAHTLLFLCISRVAKRDGKLVRKFLWAIFLGRI